MEPIRKLKPPSDSALRREIARAFPVNDPNYRPTDAPEPKLPRWDTATAIIAIARGIAQCVTCGAPTTARLLNGAAQCPRCFWSRSLNRPI